MTVEVAYVDERNNERKLNGRKRKTISLHQLIGKAVVLDVDEEESYIGILRFSYDIRGSQGFYLNDFHIKINDVSRVYVNLPYAIKLKNSVTQ